ncbi:sodium/proline symporter PutP [Sphingomonas sp. AOB5]|uniref:sodium/proline symporter PutP n=1 Tax=Sphingomonas sp. AOB5 TaxID=3034017 RepID=UPI0023F93F47|nr:sodium/proline symporter PutP [Sphingomonas sp. AOB5]MDF7774481.1 sodium/proline symporter PutP [Sphingomonas sp. AOB5]
METGVIISLGIYFALMLGIGVYAWRKSTSDIDGYMLGGRSLGPAVTALAAGASDMSGWLMMGLPGALYATGFSAGWIAVGLIAGAWLNWIIVAPRLRTRTVEVGDALTIPDYLGKRWANGDNLRLVSSTVIILFFTIYTASGMVAGGKLFESAFGQAYAPGLFITAAVVVLYTVFGGFLAVSLTDFVQGCIMFVAMILVPVIALSEIGGIGPAADAIRMADPARLDWFAGASVLSVVSALAWGLGYFGQPHIIVRFMAIRDVKEMPIARNICMVWMTVALIGAIGVGMSGFAYAAIKGIPIADKETVFIILAKLLFHPLITGFLYAAILAAIMSTIAAQLLVTSASLTEDYYRRFLRRDASQRELVTAGRLSVMLVAVIALVLAWDPNSSVLSLVANAWAGFGAAFGPVIILSLTWERMTRNGAMAGMIVGAAVVIAWIQLGWSEQLYEIVPGFVAAWIAIVGVSLLERK